MSTLNLHLFNGKRILCIAEIRGNISELNKLAREFNADYIIHTGDFGFFDENSWKQIEEEPLKHWITYTPLIDNETRKRLVNCDSTTLFKQVGDSPHTLLSELPLLLWDQIQLEVPVYTVWGAIEDLAVIEKFRSKEYQIRNLFILDEATSHVIDIEGVSLRLFGLGGGVVQHKLFDNGEGEGTIAGGKGTMWTTACQIGELVALALNVSDPTETRILVTHASPSRVGLLAQLALKLNVDFTISAGLHFRYNIAYNEFACQPDIEHFCNRLIESRDTFSEFWESIKEAVGQSADDVQRVLLNHTLEVVNYIPEIEPEDPAYKNMWNFNLPDTAFGALIFNIQNGVISSETKSRGLNFSFRRNSQQQQKTSSPALSSFSASNNSNNVAAEKLNSFRNSSNEWNNNNNNQQYQSNGGNFNNNNGRRQSMQQRSPFTLYVGGLSNKTMTEDDIIECFGYENVTNVKFPIDPTTQSPKPHCYVEFANEMALEKAIEKNGSVFRENKLIVNRPKSPFADNNNRGRGGGNSGGRGGIRSRNSRVFVNEHQQ